MPDHASVRCFLNHEVKDILHVLFIREQLNPNAISRAGYFQKPQFVV
ncbi:hypothetical protein THH46_11650 [Pseudomonas sp. NA13]